MFRQCIQKENAYMYTKLYYKYIHRTRAHTRAHAHARTRLVRSKFSDFLNLLFLPKMSHHPTRSYVKTHTDPAEADAETNRIETSHSASNKQNQ